MLPVRMARKAILLVAVGVLLSASAVVAQTGGFDLTSI